MKNKRVRVRHALQSRIYTFSRPSRRFFKSTMVLWRSLKVQTIMIKSLEKLQAIPCLLSRFNYVTYWDLT